MNDSLIDKIAASQKMGMKMFRVISCMASKVRYFKLNIKPISSRVGEVYGEISETTLLCHSNMNCRSILAFDAFHSLHKHIQVCFITWVISVVTIVIVG